MCVLVTMVISSPVLILVEPIDVLAASTANNSNRVDRSSYHSTPQVSETLATPITTANDGDFTTQAALSFARTTQTTDIVNSKSYYDVMFSTSTAGAIKSIQVDFPAGTYVGVAYLVEATGIGPGHISAVTSQRLIYTVANAVNVPAGKEIRLEFANIRNPSIPSDVLTISITTRDSASAIIDGPTVTKVYGIKKVGTKDIADNAVTGKQVHDLDELFFKTCIINWGTVLAGEQRSADCFVQDPLMFDQIYRPVATQFSGNPGLTLLMVESPGCADTGCHRMTFHVANNTPNDLNIGVVTYAVILFFCDSNQPCPQQ